MPLVSTPPAPNALANRAQLAPRVVWRMTMALTALVWVWTVWSHRQSAARYNAHPTASASWDAELARGGHHALSSDDTHRLALEASRMQDA